MYVILEVFGSQYESQEVSDLSVVRSASKGGVVLSFCSAACTVTLIGTLVNSHSKSKDTMISVSRIVSLLIVDTK